MVFGGNPIYYVSRSKLLASSWEIKGSLWHSCSASSLRERKKMKSFAHLWAEGYSTNTGLKSLRFFLEVPFSVKLVSFLNAC